MPLDEADAQTAFPEWRPDAVHRWLEPSDEGGGVRGPVALPDAAGRPHVELPRSVFDCISLDGLRDHPSVDPLVRAQLDAGVSFRLLRFPFSLRRPADGRVREIVFSVRLDGGDGSGPPRVHSIHPTREETHDEVATDVALEPQLSLGSLAQVGVGRIGRTVTARRSRAAVVGLWGELGADWVLQTPNRSDSGLDGTWEFLSVVRWDGPPGRLSALLAVSATVETSRRLWTTKRVEHAYGPYELVGCQAIV
ncbi:hypothetical protein ACFVZW_05660 [Streptomyces sp. NPDC059567]|uniref:hypothetical protein n=1 Tax=Streptomyces sp. NPDC059567 TaxID=3346867 RepID=UPI00369C028E